MGERQLVGPDFIQESIEKVKLIRERLKAAQSRQKSYADTRRRNLEFETGNHVFLKISPIKGIYRFGIKGKLSPRYVGPFEILERVGKVSYKLALPPALASVHNVFHISMLRKYIPNPEDIVELEALQLEKDLTYEEYPVRILDKQDRKLRN